MPSTAIRSQGAVIALGDGASPEVFTDIANVTSISGPTLAASDIEVTDLSSAAKEFLQGLEDPSVVTLTCYYASANTQHQTMRDRVGSNTADNYRITLSDASTISFSARVNEFSLDLGVDAAVGMSLSLKISGAVTFS